jgi:ornithine cyclodeaminase
MVLVLDDNDIIASLGAGRAISWMRDAILAAHRGRLSSPPRVHTDLGAGRLVFTTGALAHTWFGYRSYDTFDVEPGEQVVVVHDAEQGRVRGIAVGNELGLRRVGAIGGVAADVLARPDSRSLGLIGTGRQAWAQLWAMSAIRELRSVRVFSRDPVRRAAFAARASDELGLDAVPSGSAAEAVRGADIVVLATNSPSPVVDPAWIGPGTFVTTLGPKQIGRAEFAPDLAAAVDVAVTDSIGQIGAYEPPHILHGTPLEHRLASLGAVLAGAVRGRTTDDERILFLSVGLAGTEAYLLHRLVESAG